MTEYTPTDNEVREDFAYPWQGFQQDRGARLNAFDRWLAEHDRQVARAAWHAGMLAPTTADNPYATKAADV